MIFDFYASIGSQSVGEFLPVFIFSYIISKHLALIQKKKKKKKKKKKTKQKEK